MGAVTRYSTPIRVDDMPWSGRRATRDRPPRRRHACGPGAHFATPVARKRENGRLHGPWPAQPWLPAARPYNRRLLQPPDGPFVCVRPGHGQHPADSRRQRPALTVTARSTSEGTIVRRTLSVVVPKSPLPAEDVSPLSLCRSAAAPAPIAEKDVDPELTCRRPRAGGTPVPGFPAVTVEVRWFVAARSGARGVPARWHSRRAFAGPQCGAPAEVTTPVQTTGVDLCTAPSTPLISRPPSHSLGL